MKYIVTGKIKVDGELLKRNSVIDLEPEEGDRLVAGGYLCGPSAEDREVYEKVIADSEADVAAASEKAVAKNAAKKAK